MSPKGQAAYSARREDGWAGWLALAIGLLTLAGGTGARPLVNFHLDIARYLYESELAATGLTPYRDFTFPYPPLGLWLQAGWFKLFGVGFAQAAYLNAGISAAVCGLLCRLSLAGGCRPLQAVALTLYAAVVSWSAVQMELFSPNVYSFSMLAGILCGLVLLLGLVRLLDEGDRRSRLRGRGLAFAGLWGCLMSKQEMALASLACVGAFGVFRLARSKSGAGSVGCRWQLFREMTFAGAAVMATVLSYGIIAAAAGWDNLRQGLLGYGLAGNDSAAYWKQLPTLIPALLRLSCASAGVGAMCLLLTHLPQIRIKLLDEWQRPLVGGTLLLVLAGGMVKTAPIFAYMALPLLLLLFVVHAWRMDRGAVISREAACQALVGLFLFVASLRSYVADPQAYFSQSFLYLAVVPVFGSAFLLLNRNCLEFPTAGGTGWLRREALLIWVALLTLLTAYYYRTPGIHSGHSLRPMVEVATPRGRIRLSERDAGGLQELIQFVAAKCETAEEIGILPYSNGLNFVLGHRNPFRQTQYAKLHPEGRLKEAIENEYVGSRPRYIFVLRRESPPWQWLEDQSKRDVPALWKALASDYDLVTTLGRRSNLSFDVYRYRPAAAGSGK